MIQKSAMKCRLSDNSFKRSHRRRNIICSRWFNNYCNLGLRVGTPPAGGIRELRGAWKVERGAFR